LQVDGGLLTEALVVVVQSRCLSLGSFVDALDAVLENLHVLCVGLDLLVQELEVLHLSQCWVERHVAMHGRNCTIGP